MRQGKRDGWLQFCAGIGVNADALTAPFLDDIEWAMSVAESVSEALGDTWRDEPGDAEEIAKRELEALTDVWDEVV